MIACPGCGANLKFDIASQQMKCEHCGQFHDPYLFENMTQDAEADKSFDVLVYRCPGCGAELLTTEETEATAFCSYCGNPSILFDRLQKIQYPSWIIPFQLTKEDCKRAYLREARKAVFTPSKYKKRELIDSFRGIYMPYWSYQVEQKGTVSLKAEGSPKRDGDYRETNEYQVETEVDLSYDGYTHDASRSFDDEISECLEPFTAEARKPFTPGYLSGFYVDGADESRTKYKNRAKKHFEQLTAERIIGSRAGFTMANGDVLFPTGIQDVSVPTKVTAIEQILKPVWFMSYRDGNRITYATVNGETGKVVADFPISPLRYLIAVLLAAAVLFVGLNFFFTLKPEWALAVTAALMMLGIWVSERPYRLANRKAKSEQAKAGNQRKNQNSGIIFSLLFALIPGILSIREAPLFGILWIGIGLLSIRKPLEELISGHSSKKDQQELPPRQAGYQLPGWIKALAWIMLAVSVTVLLLKPVYNTVYYSIGFVNALVVFTAIFQSFRYQMKLAMRRPPQFNRKGEEDSV